jgi:hypothetical protein
MVSVTTKMSTPGQRMRQRAARVHQMKVRPGIRVEPANDDMRRLLVHPRVGHFRKEGSMEWPDDSFTHRRLRDGDVKRVEQKAEHKDGEHGEHKERSKSPPQPPKNAA